MAASCASNAMLPPPQESFENSKAAQEYLQVWARAHGYAVVLSRSAKAGRYLYFICDKGGEYRNTRKIQDEDRQRKTSTRKAGCTFRANISGSTDIWTITVPCPAHTGHDALNTTLAHPVHRRVDVALREQVLELVRHGSTARQIVPLLAQREPPLLVTSKDIANLIQSYRREVLQGRPPADALLEWLEEQHWPHRTLLGAVSEKVQRLEGLFFAHPQGLKLLQRFGSVITVDATYNTNSHRMPLLHFVGLTSSNRSFTAAFAYLPDETTLTYMWAFNALKELAPQFAPEVIVTDHNAALSAALLNTMPNAAQILCQWHVRQNVEKFARPRLPNQAEYEQFLSDFDELRDARTLDRLQDQSDALRYEWQDAQPALVDYIDEKLSAEHLWVAAYIDRHPHMGNRVTSRTEGAHATLKRYLHTRHGNLFTATQAMQNHFVTQHNHIASDLANDCQKVPFNILGDPFFVELSKNVSRHVLSILKTQDEVARRIAFQEKLAAKAASGSTSTSSGPASASPASSCACSLPATMGIPCHHTLRLLHDLGLPIPLQSIHPQWRTIAECSERVSRVLDPLRPRKKGQALATTVNGRIMTGNEVVQAQAKKLQRRCKNCHQPGHNSNKCPLPCGRCRSSAHKLNQCPE